MIIWSGWGFLGILLPVLGAFVTMFISGAIFGNGYMRMHTWPMGLGTLLGAAALYLIAVKLDSGGRTLVDPATGQTVVLRRRDSLFFIPIKWIAVVAAVLGLLLFLIPAKAPRTGGTVPQGHTRVLLPPANSAV